MQSITHNNGYNTDLTIGIPAVDSMAKTTNLRNESMSNDPTQLPNRTHAKITGSQCPNQNQPCDNILEPEHSKELRVKDLKKSCLLIHDGSFSGFCVEKFKKDYEISSFKVKNILHCLNNSDLNTKITSLSPDIVYIHTGISGVSGKPAQQLSDALISLSKTILESTNAKVCLSEIVLGGDVVTRNKISTLNRDVSDAVTNTRKQNKSYESRLCTFNNRKVEGHINWLPGESPEFKLTEKGSKLLWIRLKYGLDKIANLSRRPLINTPPNKINKNINV